MNSPLLLAAAFAAVAIPAFASASAVGDCQIGAYRLTDGSMVDIAPSDGDTLRWRRFDGTTGALRKAADGAWIGAYGWTDRKDGTVVTFSPCPAETIAFNGLAGRRIGFDVTNADFEDRGTKLVGRLVMPKGAGRVPVAVLIHGSENDSALDFYSLQRMLPAEGVGVFVYDKRGTGASGGKYTQDFDLLADDAVAAMHEARKLAGARAGRVGYQGGSEGGWVAPLAATRASVDFVVVCFGLAVSPIEEDREEIRLEMSLAGHNRADIAKALEVGEAAEAIMESGFTKGFERFDALRAKYRGEPWYKDLRGNLTRVFLPLNEAQLKAMGAKYNWGTPMNYDSMPVLRAVAAPQLWILGGEDLDAPSAETARRLDGLAAQGRPITVAIFPHAEHGMTQFETGPDGKRVSTRYAPGYFAMMADYIRDGRLAGPYGDSTISRPKGR
ncbi:MAG: alpha/beta hydrolase family protein [Caulobacteraceae bacterium]